MKKRFEEYEASTGGGSTIWEAYKNYFGGLVFNFYSIPFRFALLPLSYRYSDHLQKNLPPLERMKEGDKVCQMYLFAFGAYCSGGFWCVL